MSSLEDLYVFEYGHSLVPLTTADSIHFACNRDSQLIDNIVIVSRQPYQKEVTKAVSFRIDPMLEKAGNNLFHSLSSFLQTTDMRLAAWTTVCPTPSQSRICRAWNLLHIKIETSKTTQWHRVVKIAQMQSVSFRIP